MLLRRFMASSHAMASDSLRPPAHGLGRRLATVVLLAAVLCCAIAFGVWHHGALSRAIGALPAEERHAEFLRTRQEVESVCAKPPPALRRHCQQQALFLSNFPECDAACQELVRSQFPPEPPR